MVKIKYIFTATCIFWLTAESIFAGNDNYPAGTRNAALAGLGVMLPDFWSVSHNQAGLGYYNQLSAGVHHENRFFVPEFNLHSIGMTFPVSNATIGASFNYFGYHAYNETKLGLGIGKAFHEKFAAGVQLDYLHIHSFEESSNSTAVAAEAGIIAQPASGLYIGFHIFNPTGSRHTGIAGDELIPVIIRFGLGYYFSEKLFIGVETEKDLELTHPAYRTGLEYRLTENVFARTGVQLAGDYIQHAFGMGIEMGRIHADIAFMHQQVLGYTPFLSFTYQFS